MKSERPSDGFIIMRCTQYAILLGVLSSLGLSAIMQYLHGITNHRSNSIAQRLYVVQRYRRKILHVERHLRQLTMSRAGVYVCFDRRTTAITRVSWCRVATATFDRLFSPITIFSILKLKMKIDVWRHKFIIFSLFRTAMVLWNPFK